MSGLRSTPSQPRRGIRSQVFPLENGGPDKAAVITSCHARTRSRIRYASVTQPWVREPKFELRTRAFVSKLI